MMRDRSPLPLPLLALTALAGLLGAPARALQEAPQAPAAVDAPSFEEVRASLAARIERGRYRGAVTVVEMGPERVFEAALGERDSQAGTPMRGDEIFRIYSMSKPITAAAALILLEEGAFTLETPLSELCPEFGELVVGVEAEDGSLARVPLEREIRMVDLFRHTAGFTYGYFAESAVDELTMAIEPLDLTRDLAEFTQRLATVPLKHQPGTVFEYSLASDVLGRVVEVASEQRFSAFLEERLFGPLGMVDTGFHVPEAKLERLPSCHVRQDGALVLAPASEIAPAGYPPAFESGGGGLYSTADDYLRFARMLLNGGELDGVRVLRVDTVALMLSDHLDGRPAPMLGLTGSAFGLGLAVRTSSGARGPHAGSAWWGGYAGTHFWIDPELDLAAVFLIQNLAEPLHGSGFERDVYRALGR